MNPTRSQAEIDILRSSPLFQLSLGSKELFHSNFLAWLFEEYPQESGRALSRFLKKDEGSAVVGPVLREQNNRDLTITFKNGQELVVENKVKSLPYVAQLERYSKGAKENQNFLLLSLMLPPFSEGKSIIKVKAEQVESGYVDWHTLMYSDLPALLEQIGSGITNEYHRAILADYISFISSFSSIFTSDSQSENDLFADFHSGPALKELRDLRMGDIYQKLRYEAVAGRIHEALASVYPGLALSDTDDGARQPGHVCITHGMYNSQGLVTVAYVIAKGLYLTVQIQGGSYRHMVAGYGGYGTASRRVAERLRAKKLWFDFTNFATPKEYPRGAKDFNEFSGVDFYRSIKLGAALTVQDIISFVVRDIGHIEKSKQQIMAEVE